MVVFCRKTQGKQWEAFKYEYQLFCVAEFAELSVGTMSKRRYFSHWHPGHYWVNMKTYCSPCIQVDMKLRYGEDTTPVWRVQSPEAHADAPSMCAQQRSRTDPHEREYMVVNHTRFAVV